MAKHATRFGNRVRFTNRQVSPIDRSLRSMVWRCNANYAVYRTPRARIQDPVVVQGAARHIRLLSSLYPAVHV